MTEPFFPLTALSEAQRAQALERFTIIRPALEEGVSWTQVARTSQVAPSTVQLWIKRYPPFSAAWVSLESSDDDLIRFWLYVFTALERVHTGSGASALALLQRSDPQQLPPIETILTVWINGLTALPHEEVVLILDDYHLITPPPDPSIRHLSHRPSAAPPPSSRGNTGRSSSSPGTSAHAWSLDRNPRG